MSEQEKQKEQPEPPVPFDNGPKFAMDSLPPGLKQPEPLPQEQKPSGSR